MTILGLVLIILAWIVQARSVFEGAHSLQPMFVKAYALGTILLTVSAFRNGDTAVALCNLIIALLVSALIGKTTKVHKL